MRALKISLTAFLACILFVIGCQSGAGRRDNRSVLGPQKKRIEKLAGDVDVVPSTDELDRGRVLISYSDCFACHKEADRKRGPAFKDIAARYPMNSTYIRILAKRIVVGTKGSWGNVVMPPHPAISEIDAEKMVAYILSLDGTD